MRRLLLAFVLSACAVSAACDGGPLELDDNATDAVAAVVGDAGAAPRASQMSLASLTQAALRHIYREQGISAVLRLVPDDAASVEQAQATLVLRVFGDSIIDRVLADAAGRSDALRSHVPAGEAAGAGIRELLDGAARSAEASSQARTAGDARAALLHATAAVTAAEAARRQSDHVAGRAGLGGLAADAVTRLRSGDAALIGDSAADLLRRHTRLRVAAANALVSGNAAAADAAQQRLRQDEIALVLRVSGESVVDTLLDRAWSRLQAVEAQAKDTRFKDDGRSRRIAAAARDLLLRARAHHERRDAAAALDLGSHAVGLMNTIDAAGTSGIR